VSLGLLSEDARNLILAAALLSIIVNPMFFVLLDRWSAKHEAQNRVASESSLRAEEEDLLPDRALIPAANHIILIGYGRVGSRVGPVLQQHGTPLVLIDSNRDHCIDARAAGIPCIYGNALSEGVLKDANIGTARALLLAISQALEAGPIIRLARESNPGIAILARAHSDEEVAYLHKVGVDATIMGESEIARSMCDSVESLLRLAQRLEAANRVPGDDPAADAQGA
ncbi:MAG: NAD-binding protein, partial [Dokdonella sp.]|uniref:NAD-binding protein n=1 Tax=Dokdonella sp. TaxID=2291710 RepID=UPI003BAF11F2